MFVSLVWLFRCVLVMCWHFFLFPWIDGYICGFMADYVGGSMVGLLDDVSIGYTDE
jgi:hypothetical protein